MIALRGAFGVTMFSAPLTLGAQVNPADSLTYSGPAWSPYLVGTLVGILACLTLAGQGSVAVVATLMYCAPSVCLPRVIRLEA